jgi:uncharacterized membrane protein YbhN (UPF0104 family)
MGWGRLLAPWRTFPPGLLAWLLLLTALSYGLRAVRVYDWWRPRLAGRFWVVLRLSVLHNAANNLLPMRSGEMVFPWLMRRWLGQGFFDSAAALLWLRLLDMHYMGLVAILILELRSPSWLWRVAALLWLGAIPLVAMVGRAGLGESAGGRLSRLIRRVAGAAPADPWVVARVYLWTAATWTLKLAAFASVLQHFVPADFWRIMAGVMGAELSSILPFHGIAGSGSYEIAAMAALVPLGIGPEQALAGAVNLHLFVLGTTLLLGGAALLAQGVGARAVGPDRAAPPVVPGGAGRRDPTHQQRSIE